MCGDLYRRIDCRPVADFTVYDFAPTIRKSWKRYL
jgi:hypothetical protein